MSDLLDLADRLIDRARPGEQVEAYVAAAREVQVRAYDGAVESLSSARSAGAGLRVVVDGRQGFAWAGSLDEAVLAEALDDARDNARHAEPDEHAGLAEPDGVEPTTPTLVDAAFADATTDDKVALALDLEAATLAADDRLVGVESAEYVDVEARLAIASTAGVRAVDAETSCYLAVYALAEADDELQTGFGFSVARAPRDLSVADASGDAARRATRLLGAVRPPTGRTTVVLDPWVTAQLLEIVASTLDGESVAKGRSPFAGRVGEAIAAPCVHLVEDPTDPEAFGAGTVDAEGLAHRRVELLAGGVLQGFLHDATSARRAGVASTASALRSGFRSTPEPGASAVALRPGSRLQAALLADLDDAVLVSEVSGLHSGVNPTSGDFSTGAEGLRIRDGAVAEPLREFTIASTLQRLLLDVREVGGDVEHLPLGALGVSLVVDDVTVSGA